MGLEQVKGMYGEPVSLHQFKHPLALSAHYLGKLQLMDLLRWDARYVQKGAEGQEKHLPVEAREKAYATALEIIRRNPCYVQPDAKEDFFDVAERLARGEEITPDEADLAARMFGQYNRLFLSRFHEALH